MGNAVGIITTKALSVRGKTGSERRFFGQAARRIFESCSSAQAT